MQMAKHSYRGCNNKLGTILPRFRLCFTQILHTIVLTAKENQDAGEPYVGNFIYSWEGHCQNGEYSFTGHKRPSRAELLKIPALLYLFITSALINGLLQLITSKCIKDSIACPINHALPHLATRQKGIPCPRSTAGLGAVQSAMANLLQVDQGSGGQSPQTELFHRSQSEVWKPAPDFGLALLLQALGFAAVEQHYSVLPRPIAPTHCCCSMFHSTFCSDDAQRFNKRVWHLNVVP